MLLLPEVLEFAALAELLFAAQVAAAAQLLRQLEVLPELESTVLVLAQQVEQLQLVVVLV